MEEFNAIAMVVKCPEPGCIMEAGTMCVGSSMSGTTHWYLQECHAARYAAGVVELNKKYAKALDETAF